MQKKQKSLHKKIWIAAGAIFLILAILVGVFFWYVSDYYRAEDVALEVLAQDNSITVQDNLTILSPSYPTDTAIIFYPGAKVEAEAYLPLLDQIRQTGVTCILVHMPFHMAIFDADAAEDVISEFSDIEHWYIAGHSMGGAMASQFASNHPDQVEGLVLMGAYIYGDYPLENTLTVYGTLDGLAAEDIDYTTNTVPIEGGNHAQFGNYGPQKGDLPATISTEEQQAQTVTAIEAFIEQQIIQHGQEEPISHE
ncbi:MAG: alpha/beta fold hydrolase [Lachnospiraceae bacterium]|nr:alpha/beta fold hydrolase [Lachnospiraceae bacterium]